MKEIERMIFILLWIICTACNSGKPSAAFDRPEQMMQFQTCSWDSIQNNPYICRSIKIQT